MSSGDTNHSRFPSEKMLSARIYSGENKTHIVNELISMGMDAVEADFLIKKLDSEVRVHNRSILKYFLYTLVTTLFVVAILFMLVNKDNINICMKYAGISVFIMFLVDAVVPDELGKSNAYAKLMIRNLTWIFLLVLSILFVLHEPWVEISDQYHNTQIIMKTLLLIIDFIIRIGPFWIGIIFFVMTFSSWFWSLGEWVRIKERTYHRSRE